MVCFIFCNISTSLNKHTFYGLLSSNEKLWNSKFNKNLILYLTRICFQNDWFAAKKLISDIWNVFFFYQWICLHTIKKCRYSSCAMFENNHVLVQYIWNFDFNIKIIIMNLYPNLCFKVCSCLIIRRKILCKSCAFQLFLSLHCTIVLQVR